MDEDPRSPKAAQDTPRCQLCNQHHLHMSRPQQWKDSSSCELAMEMGLTMDSIICRPCRHDLSRLKSTTSYIPRWEKCSNQPSLCAVKQCDEKVFCSLQIANKEQITQTLKLKSKESETPAALCKQHYYKAYHTLFPTQFNCPTCGVPMKKTACRSCPDPLYIQQFLQETTDFKGQIQQNDLVCYECYKAHVGILKAKAPQESLDCDLREVIEGYRSNSELSEACKVTIVMVGTTLLDRNVLLLSDVHEYYCSTVKKLACRANLENEKGDCKITAMWVLSMLSTHLQHHITWACTAKKYGTLLYRPGTDLIAPLQLAMWRLRHGQSKSKLEGQGHTDKADETLHTCRLDETLNNLNAKVHAQIRKQLALNHQTSFDPVIDFNVSSLVDEIDPQLWTAICTLTQSVRESKGAPTSTAVEHLKTIRRLFILHAILFCTDDRCSFPLHTLITDIVDSQGGSSLLIKILNRFGVCSSYDTLSRYIQTKAESETPAKTLDPTAFTVISADNIDYLHSYARVYNGKQESSWHGTSIQAVQPNPTLSPAYTQGESSTLTCTSTASSRCTVEAPKDPHVSYQLSMLEQKRKRKRRARTGTECTHCIIPTPSTANTHGTLPPVLHPTPAPGSKTALPGKHGNTPHPTAAPGSETALPGEHGNTPQPPHPTAAPGSETALPGEHGNTPHPPHPTAAPGSETALPGEHGNTPHPPHPTAAPGSETALPGKHGNTPQPPSKNKLPPKLTIQDFLMSDNELESLMEIQQDIHCYLLQKVLAEGKTDKAYISMQEYLDVIRPSHAAQSTVAYLEVMASNAENKDTMLEMINKLHEEYIVQQKKEWLVITGDAKVYDVLHSLKDEYGDDLKWVIPYPGDFHLLMNYQTALMKCYYDAGLKSLATAAGYPTAAIQTCSQFKRTHKFIFEAWEAVYQSMIAAFLQQSKDNHETTTLLTAAATAIHTLDDKLKSKKISEMHKALHKHNLDHQQEFKAFIQKMANQDDTWKFWVRFVFQDAMSYVGLFLAVRGGDWNLRVGCLKEMAPLFTAYDHQTYQKLIARHIADLSSMPSQILTMFQQGAFTVSIKGKPWHSVAIDEAHEMLINKSCKLSITKPNADNINRIVKYLPYRSKLLEKINLELFPNEAPEHSLFNSSENLKREANIKAQKTVINEKQLLSTSLLSNRGLINPFTKKVASPQQNHDLINARSIGKQEFLMYASAHLVKIPTVKTSMRKRRLCTFSERRVTKQRITQLEKDRKILLTCFRKKLKWSKITGRAVDELGEQLIALPLAISDHEGIPLKGQKSYMTKFYKGRYQTSQVFTDKYPVGWSPQCIIYDGMFLINSTPLGSHKNMADYANFLIRRFFTPYLEKGCAEVHAVFDNPDNNHPSPKLIEQKRRDTAAPVKTNHTCQEFKSTTLIKGNWRENVINCRTCKRSLVKFIGEYILNHIQPHLATNQKCFVAGCFEGNLTNTCWYVQGENRAEPEPTLTSNAPEADTRVWLHAKVTTANNILVISPDTDTYHIGFGLPCINEKHILVQISQLSSKGLEFLDVTRFLEILKGDPDLATLSDTTIPKTLQTLFIATGCDYVSFFSGVGKSTFAKYFYQHASFITGSKGVGTLCDHTKEGFLAFLRLIGTVYFKKHVSAFEANSPDALYRQMDSSKSEEERHYQWLETIRQEIWDRITYENDMIPSTSALWRHWLRTLWVMKYWMHADKNVMTIEEPQDHGWKYERDELIVEWDSEENTRKVQERVKLLTKGCKCRTGCTTHRCSCRKSGDTCSVGCECINCGNLKCKENEQESQTAQIDNLTVEEDVCSRKEEDIAEDMDDWIDEFTTEPLDNELDSDI